MQKDNPTATVDDVKAFWERNLNGHKFVNHEYAVNTPEYFEDGKRIRYKYHYHIPLLLDRLRAMKPGGSVLEIGLGLGCDTALLCEKGFQVSGIDLTAASVESTRARLHFYGYQADINQGNAENIAYPDNTFDAVYSFGVLHHTPDTQHSIREVHRILKPGGIALIMLYHKTSLNYLAHCLTNTQYDGTKSDHCPVERAYTKKELYRLFGDYSRVSIEIDYLFGTGWGVVNRFVPLGLKKILARRWGWHAMMWATK